MAAQESIYTCSKCAQSFSAYTQLEAEVLHKAYSPNCGNTQFTKTPVKKTKTGLYERVETRQESKLEG